MAEEQSVTSSVSGAVQGYTPEGDSDEVAQARAQIEATRAHMTDTIDEIKYRLSPSTLIEEAKEATIHKAEETVSEVVDAVKEKAAGVAEFASDAYHAATDKISDVAHNVADAVTGVTHRAADAVSDAKQSVADRVAAFHDHHTDGTIDSSGRYYRNTNSPNTATAIGASIVETIKLNPVPAAIAGFGLAWLILSAQRSHSATTLATPVYPDTSVDTSPHLLDKASDLAHRVGDQASDAAHSVSDKASGIAHSVSDKASGIAHSVSDKASDIAQNVSDKASTAAQAITDRASDLKDKATDWAGGVRDSASQLRDKAGDTVHNLGVQAKEQAGAGVDVVSKFIQEQPIAAGAIALLLGAVVAYSLPSTQKENQVLGPQRDRLVDQGKDAAQDVAHRVQSVANVALGKAQQSLTETASQAKQQIQQTVQDTKEAVVSEAQNQGLAAANPA